MGSSKMKRVGLYLNEDLIKRADVLVSELGYGSRNEFFRRAVEEYITNCILKEEEKPLSKKSRGSNQKLLKRYKQNYRPGDVQIRGSARNADIFGGK